MPDWIEREDGQTDNRPTIYVYRYGGDQCDVSMLVANVRWPARQHGEASE